MKTCTKCKESKPLEEFQKLARNKDGYASYCKLCKRAYDNAHYNANPERKAYIRSNSAKRVEETRKWIFEYLRNNPCIDCGEDDILVLEFDHRSDKTMDVSRMIQRCSIKTIAKEVAKCDVRCANDHRRKTAKTLGSWRIDALEALR